MRTVPGSTSLVVVGQWNPAIIQPNWVSQHVLGTPAGEPVEVMMEFASVPGVPPRFTLADLAYIPEYARLQVRPNSLALDRLAAAERNVMTILRELPHTPVTAFGQNFEFVEQDPAPELSGVFNLNDPVPGFLAQPIEARSTRITTSFLVGDCTANLTRTLRHDGAMSLAVNFNFTVASATEAAEKMQGSFERSKALTRQILVGYNALPEDFD